GVDLHLDLDHVSGARTRCGDRCTYAACDGNVVVLDEDGVEQADAMVHAASCAHGIFLERAEPGRGFARVDDCGAGAGDGIDIATCQRGDAAQTTDEIECDALRRQQRAGAAADTGDPGAFLDPITIRDQRLELYRG